ncbi:hypothetical protein C7974DRAFT_402341 [Boeremia exigua]|uniref:uncharacterized protein n=1 Tax=Boeremia exigua TaxID=749465 RepID=UPI001E8E26F9|nr:uncharacterized protein C7974DRAFT_402341 [Boeremia exigua]KAH6616729.1 hypothetical protein C7974DRAFT_402341 [Boeremia exigua]
MFFTTQYIALATIASTLVNALPLDISQPRDLVPRAKSYSVINVDGGASTAAPADATTVQVEGPTVTAEITATTTKPVPVPVATSTSTSCTSSSTSQPSSSTPTPTSSSTTTTQIASSTTEAPKPVFVTVTVTDGGPTEYYDNGLWHTSYRVKTFEAVATPSLP